MNMNVEWVAVDWGTSNLRVWALGSDGSIVGRASSNRGMGTLKPEEFEEALTELIEQFLPAKGSMPVVCCGMVGARQGWLEAPYIAVPCKPSDTANAVFPVTVDPRLSISILPGVSQAKPSDVMRGEETQIAGYLALDPTFEGVLCLPGTHTKWVHISAGEIVSFKTFMTGELFALLSDHSVLRHSLGKEGWSEESFASGVETAFSRPQTFASDLFSLRAADLLEGLDPIVAKTKLSGMLIGLELAGARPYWLGQRIVLLGAGELSKKYQFALSILGSEAEIINAADITLAGLQAAYLDMRSQYEP